MCIPQGRINPRLLQSESSRQMESLSPTLNHVSLFSDGVCVNRGVCGAHRLPCYTTSTATDCKDGEGPKRCMQARAEKVNEREEIKGRTTKVLPVWAGERVKRYRFLLSFWVRISACMYAAAAYVPFIRTSRGKPREVISKGVCPIFRAASNSLSTT